MIALDFFSGSHGHFLEYVINTWIFKGPRVSNIFTDLGTCHQIRKDPAYMHNKIVHAGHYTEFCKELNSPTKVIRINIDNNWVNWVYQINVMSRAGDIPLEKKLKLTGNDVRHSPGQLRNEWYAKFNSQDHGYPLPVEWRWPDAPAFDFAMQSLFDPLEFYNNLHTLSEFLEMTFVPDQELYDLLQKFLELNQGWQYYTKSKKIVCAAFAGENTVFDSNEISQALINSMLTKSVGMFDGGLFADDAYPQTTKEIWNAVHHHQTMFDSRF
jgi:hypothetical protein